jgi:5-hydroxyisourate hydrolase
MSAITTHVLDTSRGRPATGVPVVLERRLPDHTWTMIGTGETDQDGRVRALVAGNAPLIPGTYRLILDTQRYFDTVGVQSFYPSIAVTFEAVPGEPHYHIPVLLSPFGYTTYRGS